MSDLTDAIGGLKDDHLLCRDLGHRWSLKAHHSRLVETLADDHHPVVERIVSCTICHATRTEQISRRTGEMIRRLYKYPEGYQFEPGIAGKGGRPKAPFRAEWIRRVVKDDE